MGPKKVAAAGLAVMRVSMFLAFEGRLTLFRASLPVSFNPFFRQT